MPQSSKTDSARRREDAFASLAAAHCIRFGRRTDSGEFPASVARDAGRAARRADRSPMRGSRG